MEYCVAIKKKKKEDFHKLIWSDFQDKLLNK